jgi:hypothetical protein
MVSGRRNRSGSRSPSILTEADYGERNEPELAAVANVVITTTDELLFLCEPLAGRVKARPADRNFRRARSRRAFTPAVILFIALPEAKDNIDPG